jgi:hypothetical protein
VLHVEPASSEEHGSRLVDRLRGDLEVALVEGRPRVSGLGKYVIQIHADELRNGKPFKRCSRCTLVKDINEFGLRRKSGAAKHGHDVITTQAWCSACRSGSSEGDE